MRTLFLIPPKTLSQTDLLGWNSIFKENDVLFTYFSSEYGIDAKWLDSLHCSYKVFSNFNSNGLIERVAIEMHCNNAFSAIISTAEADVLRAAKLRSLFGIQGQSVESALLYRDKNEMKNFISKHGISVPAFKKINCVLDLLSFINEVGYPVVLKPNLGAGSASTLIIKSPDDLESILEGGFIDSSYGLPDFIAESFVKGRMYHVDGLVINGEIRLNQPSAYYNTCIEFQDGTHIGSYMLDESNPLSKRLKSLNVKVIESMPGPENFAFHAEYFHDENDNIVFCEIASRPGGGAVKDMLYCKYKINIVTEWMKAEVSKQHEINVSENVKNCYGFLLIPPLAGVLKSVPDSMPFDWVSKYRLMAAVNAEYKSNVRTSGEIIAVLIEGDHEDILLNRLNAASLWLKDHIEWV